MEYLWVYMLTVVYVAMWFCVIDDWYKISWREINFQKVWVYAHIFLFLIGVAGIFVYSLYLFIRK